MRRALREDCPELLHKLAGSGLTNRALRRLAVLHCLSTCKDGGASTFSGTTAAVRSRRICEYIPKYYADGVVALMRPDSGTL